MEQLRGQLRERKARPEENDRASEAALVEAGLLTYISAARVLEERWPRVAYQLCLYASEQSLRLLKGGWRG